MTKAMYEAIEEYMRGCMKDSAHDAEHIYRVLYSALRIAGKTKEPADYDILIAACLLHDIGRDEQNANSKLCHAQVGGVKAKAFLLKNNWSEERAEHVNRCISTHRFRGDNIPESIEAKILFDADKLDAAGCIGIARTLVYQGQVGHPIYTTDEKGICEGKNKQDPESFYKEYNFKLKNLYSKFYTPAAKRLAKKMEKSAAEFFSDLSAQINDIYDQKVWVDHFIT